jgi:predicted hotdog family 3-hydroxylacyl-ACP dehydratase
MSDAPMRPDEPEEPWPDPRALLPHGPDAVFLERILERGERHLVCRVVPGTVDADHVEGGVIPAAMGVEYMAQVVGAYASLRAAPERRRDIGYVIAVRDLTLAVPEFAVGEALVVRATWQWGEDRLGRFEVSIEREGHTLARAFMSVYRPPPEEQP